MTGIHDKPCRVQVRGHHTFGDSERQTNRDGDVLWERQCMFCMMHEYSATSGAQGFNYDTRGDAFAAAKRIRQEQESHKSTPKRPSYSGPVKGGRPTAPLQAGRYYTSSSPGDIDMTTDHGKFLSYNRATELVTMTDGSIFELEELMKANPGVTENEWARELAKLPDFSPEKIKFELSKLHFTSSTPADSMRRFSDAMASATAKINGLAATMTIGADASAPGVITFDSQRDLNDYIAMVVPKPTAESSLKYLVEYVSAGAGKGFDNAAKRAAVSEWLRRITTELTNIVSELNDDEAGEDG